MGFRSSRCRFSIRAISREESAPDLANNGRQAMQAGALRGAPAAFTGDQLKEVVRQRLNNDRLNDAVGADGVREFVQASSLKCFRGCCALGRMRSISISRSCSDSIVQASVSPAGRSVRAPELFSVP